jgi:hypothetical protein
VEVEYDVVVTAAGPNEEETNSVMPASHQESAPALPSYIQSLAPA